jgi:hypothetical protein
MEVLNTTQRSNGRSEEAKGEALVVGIFEGSKRLQETTGQGAWRTTRFVESGTR